MENLPQHIEALIFGSDKPVSKQELVQALTQIFDAFIETETIDSIINDLMERYERPEYAFELIKSGGGYQFLSKPEYHDTISALLAERSKKRLSGAALETLAIIAYKQPVSKPEVEEIRGVNCDYTINKLLEKDLIRITGREDGPGKPIIYALSDTFMDYFGINSTDDLPKLNDLATDTDNSIGDPVETMKMLSTFTAMNHSLVEDKNGED